MTPTQPPTPPPKQPPTPPSIPPSRPPGGGPVPAWTILYDADCGFCRTALALVLAADRDRRLAPLALGTPAADALLTDLTADQRAASWHLVDPDGHRESAGAAAPPLLALLPGPPIAARTLARFPKSTERAYEWVVAHRGTLGRLIPSTVKRRATAAVNRRERAARP